MHRINSTHGHSHRANPYRNFNANTYANYDSHCGTDSDSLTNAQHRGHEKPLDVSILLLLPLFSRLNLTRLKFVNS